MKKQAHEPRGSLLSVAVVSNPRLEMHMRLAERKCAVPDLRFQLLLRPAAPKNAVPAFRVFMHFLFAGRKCAVPDSWLELPLRLLW
jgi:hypothetical protein